MSADRVHQLGSCCSPGVEAVRPVLGDEPLPVIVDRSDPAVVVVRVAGDIDLRTESALRGQLGTVFATRPECVIIDFSEVSFLGAAGLSVLISARRAAAHQSTRLQLRAPSRQVMSRALQVTGLDRLVEIVPPAPGPPNPQRRCPGEHRPERHPGGGDRDAATAVTGAGSDVGTEADEYAHLVPLQRRYAALPAGDPQRPRLRDQLIAGYLPVAQHLARRFAGRGQDLEDLTQVATVGLINAVDRFDPARGSHFLAFAVPTITGELRRYFRDHGWSTRVPRRLKDLGLAIRAAQAQLSQQRGRAARPSEIAEHLGVATSTVIEALHAAEAYKSSSLDDLLRCGDTTAPGAELFGDVDPQVGLVDDRETLRPLLAQLSPRDRRILALRFYHELTQAQIAQQVGLSQMHISRVLRQTLAFLQHRMTSE